VVPVRKPSNEWFFRVHPDPTYSLQTTVLELKDEGEIYLLNPADREVLADEPTVSARAIHLAITKQGTPFFWPIRLPRADGRSDRWSDSAMRAAASARLRWTKIKANMQLGGYEECYPVAELPDPVWPEYTMAGLLRLAFQDRRIDSFDHPVLKQLRGAL
jgi:hypothetical protein